MIVKHFKLSQPEKDRLIRIKAKTGIQNWNVLCRWALCWSLAEPSIPGGVDPQKTAACRGHPGQRKLQALSPPVSDFSCIRPDFAV